MPDHSVPPDRPDPAKLNSGGVVSDGSFSRSEGKSSVECCTPRILQDRPTDKDEFHSLEPVAIAIERLVRGHEGGKAIALEGTWGSGKSSVVRILESKLEKGGDHAVFVYDTWAHNRDPLRRSFLESLIDFLASRPTGPWVDRRTWDEKKELLSRRKVETETTKTPLLTVFGRFVAVSLLLVPLGLVLLSKVTRDERGVLPAIGGVPLWVVGLSVCLLPIVIAVGAWLSWRPDLDFLDMEFWTKNREGHENDDVTAIFLNKTTEIEKTKSTTAPEPTSVEFCSNFQALMHDAIGGADGRRRLVIVMDNLDRLGETETKDVWATMRCFFETGEKNPPPWTSRLWLLVPFDEETPAKVWGAASAGARLADRAASSGTPVSKPSDSGAATLGIADSSPTKTTGDTFVDKTFQVLFRVAPPVLSDWKVFMIAKLKEAFDGHQDTELEAVYRVFSLLGTPANYPPTPRDIKLFINKLAAVHMQWHRRVPFVMQAVYVLSGSRLSRGGLELLADGFLDPRVEATMGNSDWRVHLAALHFNVDPELANQVLLAHPIEEALTKPDPGRLSKYLELPGTDEVLLRVMQDNVRTWPAGTLAKAACCLDGVVGAQRALLDGAMGQLRRAMERIGEWNPFDVSEADGMIAATKHCSPTDRPGFAETLLKAVSAYHPKDPETDIMLMIDEQTVNWAKAAARLVSYLLEEGMERTVRDNFRVPGHPRFVVGVMQALAGSETPKTVSQHFELAAQPRDMLAHLKRHCDAGGFLQDFRNGIRLLVELHPNWDWSSLVASADARIRANQNLPLSEVHGCVQFLLDVAYASRRLPNESGGFSVLRALVESGQLFHHFQRLVTEKPNWDAAKASVVLAVLETDPVGTARGAFGLSAQGVSSYRSMIANPDAHEKVMQRFESRVAPHIGLARLLEIGSESKETRALVTWIVQRVIAAPDTPLRLTPALFVDNCDLLGEILSEQDFGALLAKLREANGFVEAVVAQEFVASRAGLYSAIWRSVEPKNRKPLADYLMSGSRTVSEQTWTQEMAEGGGLLDLALLLHTEGYNLNLTTEYEDALCEHATSLLKSDDAPDALVRRSTKLPFLLEESLRRTFCDRLLRLVGGAGKTNRGVVLGMYSDLVVKTGALAAHADVVVQVIVIPMVEDLDTVGLAWAADTLEANPNILDKFDATKSELSLRLREVVERDKVSEDVHTLLHRIAAALRIDLPPQENEEAEAETEK